MLAAALDSACVVTVFANAGACGTAGSGLSIAFNAAWLDPPRASDPEAAPLLGVRFASILSCAAGGADSSTGVCAATSEGRGPAAGADFFAALCASTVDGARGGVCGIPVGSGGLAATAEYWARGFCAKRIATAEAITMHAAAGASSSHVRSSVRGRRSKAFASACGAASAARAMTLRHPAHVARCSITATRSRGASIPSANAVSMSASGCVSVCRVRASSRCNELNSEFVNPVLSLPRTFRWIFLA